MQESRKHSTPQVTHRGRGRRRAVWWAGAGLLAAAGIGGAALIGPAQAAEAQYAVVVTDVPQGVGSVDVAANWGYLGCVPVRAGQDARTDWGLADGDTLTALWYSDGSCQTSTGHTSRTTVSGSTGSDFQFRLQATQIK